MLSTTVSGASVAAPLVLALDIGSSSTRASLFDAVAGPGTEALDRIIALHWKPAWHQRRSPAA